MFKKKQESGYREAEDERPAATESESETSSLIANLKQVAPPIKQGAARTAGSVISAELTITGNLVSKGLIEVFGKVDGNIRCASLMVGESALITGDLEAKSLMVNGRVNGTLRGADVDLGPAAHVDGDIHHQSLAIAQGAHFEGRAQRADAQRRANAAPAPAARPPAEAQPQPAPVAAAAPVAMPAQQGPANSGMAQAPVQNGQSEAEPAPAQETLPPSSGMINS